MVQYHGYIIPKGTTIFVNICEFITSIQCQALLLISTPGGIFHDPGKYTLDPTVLFKEFSAL
jgi:hypothetical protein